MSNLRFLRTFVTVARYGSFAVAADKVALTQAAVSMQMRALESELGHSLFDRSGRRALLNETGKAMLVRAERLVAQYDEMLTAAAEANEVTGTVSIGAVVSAMGSMARVVAQLKAAYPRLSIRLIAGKSIELRSRLEDGDIAAAVLAELTGRTPASLRWSPLYSEPHVLVASAQTGRIGMATLARTRPFVRFDRTQYTGVLIERALRRNKLAVNEFLELNSLEAIVELVRQDVGIAVVPLLQRASWTTDATLRILPLSSTTPRRVVGILERKDPDRLAVMQLVRQAIRDGLGAAP